MAKNSQKTVEFINRKNEENGSSEGKIYIANPQYSLRKYVTNEPAGNRGKEYMKHERPCFFFFIVETLSCSNSHSSILPRLQTTTKSETSRAGNHFTPEKIQTTPLGQGANEI